MVHTYESIRIPMLLRDIFKSNQIGNFSNVTLTTDGVLLGCSVHTETDEDVLGNGDRLHGSDCIAEMSLPIRRNASERL